MPKNMGTLDRGLRIALALIVGVLWGTGVIGGTLAIVLAALAVIFVVTSLVSFCPLYLPLKIDTSGKRAE